MSGPDWTAYAPRFLVEAVRRDPDALQHGTVLSLDAVVAFVDIAGFTPLSEALGRFGAEGTEELTELLNGWFGPVIEAAHAHGGDVAAFAGDAITVVFPCSVGGRPAALEAAVAWAGLVQGEHDRTGVTTRAGAFDLRSRTGMSAGEVTAFLAGDERLTLGVGGGAIDAAVAVAGRAGRGEMLADAALVDELPREALVEPVTASVSSVRPPPRSAPRAAGDGAVRGGSAGPEDFARLVHPRVAARVAAGRGGLVDEHRRVTTAFVQLGDAAVGDAASIASVLELSRDVFTLVTEFDGYLRQISMGDKGALAIAAFGAPVAHDDDPARAVACARALRDRIGSGCRIGVSTGRVFAGHVGGTERRDYALVGDAVNLAARLMQAADGGRVLADAVTRAAAGTRHRWTGTRELTVKGKLAALEVAELAYDRSTPRPAAVVPRQEVIGRDRELGVARRSWSAAATGAGSALVVVGEPGTGKSLLAATVADEAAAGGSAVFRGVFESFDAGAYRGWRPIVGGLLDVPGSLTAGRGEGLLDVLRRSRPEWVPLAAVVGDLLGLELPETAATRSLPPQERSDLARDLAVQLLRDRCALAPVLLLLEDVQWADEPSMALLRSVAGTAGDLPLLLVVTSRAAGELAELAHATVLDLAELDDAAARTLVASRVAEALGDDTTFELVDVIAARAGGSPLYIERLVDLVAARADGGRIDAARLELPDDLASTVLARIDRLPEDGQTVIKLASVLGNRFPRTWLAASFSGVVDAVAAERQLDALHALDLLLLHDDGGEPVHEFRHPVVRDVAYDAVARSTRAHLHAAVGHHLVEVAAEDPALVAHHFGESSETDQQRVWFERAGDRSRTTYDNDAALSWYGRLVALVQGVERARVELHRGAVLEHVGRWEEADESFAQARTVGPPAIRARARAAQGLLRLNTDPHEGRTILEDALDDAAALDDDELRAQILEYLSWSRWQASQHDGALGAARERLEIAERTGDVAGRGAAHKALGDVAWAIGDLETAASELEQAVRLAERSADVLLRLHAMTALVGVNAGRDRHRDGAGQLLEAQQLASSIGYRHVLAILWGNETELRRLEGQFTEALVRGLDALGTFRTLGDVSYLLLTHVANLASTLALAGEVAGALTVFERLTSVVRAEVNPTLPSSLAAHADVLVHAGDPGRAASLLAEGAEVAGQLGDRSAIVTIGVQRAVLTASPRDLEAAADLARSPGELAAVRWAAWRLDRRREADRLAAAEAYARLHVEAPKLEYRERHVELTGRSLHDPPSLPPIPGAVADPSAVVVAAIGALDERPVIAGTGAASPPSGLNDSRGD